MKTQTHSQRAMAAAFKALEPCHERTAVVLLGMGLANEAVRVLGQEKAAELAYSIADMLAVGAKS